MYDIITIGSATRDVFLFVKALHPHKETDAVSKVEACLPFGAKIDIERIAFDTGGGATNNAATFARLGKFKVAALTCVGDDIRGRAIFEALRADRIDTSLAQITKKDLTAYSTILSSTGKSRDRTILVYRGASAHFDAKKIPWSKLKAKWLHITSLGGDLVFLKKLLAHARKIGAQVAFNPGGAELSQLSPPLKVRGGWGELWQSITFLILNREEAAILTGVPFNNLKEILRQLARLTLSSAEGKLGVVTDGPKGAYAVTRSVILNEAQRSEGSRSLRHGIPRRLAAPRNDSRWVAYYVPSVGHKPRNLTGAGDAFGSGFVTGWIKSRGDIKYALRLASFNADSVVQHVGAKVGILEKYPSAAQLQKLAIQEIRL